MSDELTIGNIGFSPDNRNFFEKFLDENREKVKKVSDSNTKKNEKGEVVLAIEDRLENDDYFEEKLFYATKQMSEDIEYLVEGINLTYKCLKENIPESVLEIAQRYGIEIQ